MKAGEMFAKERNFKFVWFKDDKMHIKKNKITKDIICLTETWHDINYCNFLIPETKMMVSLFILNVNFFEYEYIDANIIKVTLKTDKLSLSLLCIYRSPSGNKHEFLTILNNLIITLNSSNEKIIFIGDVNLNIIGVDNVNNEYLDIMSENGFKRPSH
ncbi:Uncharacterized protein FWK35_00032027 [Aphis craccivora]|uniref:Craniofacial development protein 2-like n=1 Tax=Aphis craccivora TaxID=307492 RepID=A0A6G0VQR2_APHCR|nr:Uncharacterized protein FWK35_00032027 [Aphis craccivora]